MLFLFDNIHSRWCYFSYYSYYLFLVNVTTFLQHYYSSYFLLFIDGATRPIPCSSSTLLTLLFLALCWWCCFYLTQLLINTVALVSSTFLLLMLLLLLFDTTFAPHVLDWYSSLHVFANVGVIFQIQLLQAKLEGEVFFPKCLLIDDFFQNIIHLFFG